MHQLRSKFIKKAGRWDNRVFGVLYRLTFASDAIILVAIDSGRVTVLGGRLHMRKGILTLAATIAVAAIAASALDSAAASTNSVASVTYFATGGLPPDLALLAIDYQIRVVNHSGTQLCALFYVFDANQELSECCGCEISNAGETTTSLADLTGNPGNGIPAVNGSILLISSVDPDPKDTDINDSSFGPTACDPAAPHPAQHLEAWSTHTQTVTEITEEEFAPITLTSANLSHAASTCGFLETNGSGPGICFCSEEG
jgi:hypothetical protein